MPIDGTEFKITFGVARAGFKEGEFFTVSSDDWGDTVDVFVIDGVDKAGNKTRQYLVGDERTITATSAPTHIELGTGFTRTLRSRSDLEPYASRLTLAQAMECDARWNRGETVTLVEFRDQILKLNGTRLV